MKLVLLVSVVLFVLTFCIDAAYITKKHKLQNLSSSYLIHAEKKRLESRGEKALGMDINTGSLFEINSYTKGSPIHEMITVIALKNVNLLDTNTGHIAASRNKKYIMLEGKKGSSWEGILAYEFIRGVQWNDDPNGYLWHNDKCDEGGIPSMDLGMNFGEEFCACECRAGPYHRQDWNEIRRENGWEKESFGVNDNLLCRSHFGDLSFLHGQEPAAGVMPAYTRLKMMLWGQFQYQVAVGEISHEAKLGDLKSGSKLLDGFIKELFPKQLEKTVQQLFNIKCTWNKATAAMTTQARALGSILHTIQDSYSRSHANRDGTMNGGEIIMFTAYPIQDHDHHAHFDRLEPQDKPSDKNSLDQYEAAIKKLNGGEAAIGRCEQVAGHIDRVRKLYANINIKDEPAKYKQMRTTNMKAFLNILKATWKFAPELKLSSSGTTNTGLSIATSVSTRARTDLCAIMFNLINIRMDMEDVCTKLPKDVPKKFIGTRTIVPDSLPQDAALCKLISGCSEKQSPSSIANLGAGLNHATHGAADMSKHSYFLLKSVEIEDQEDLLGRDDVGIFVYADDKFLKKYVYAFKAGQRVILNVEFKYKHKLQVVLREIDSAFQDKWDQIGQLIFEAAENTRLDAKESVQYDALTGDARYAVEYSVCKFGDGQKCKGGQEPLGKIETVQQAVKSSSSSSSSSSSPPSTSTSSSSSV